MHATPIRACTKMSDLVRLVDINDLFLHSSGNVKTRRGVRVQSSITIWMEVTDPEDDQRLRQ